MRGHIPFCFRLGLIAAAVLAAAACSKSEPAQQTYPLVGQVMAVNAPQKVLTVKHDEFKGSPLILTFIYTRCPMSSFCPLMGRQFAEIQKSHETLRNVHLLTVTFDPETDTPPVLKRHAASLHADAERWTFLTGDRDEIE